MEDIEALNEGGESMERFYVKAVKEMNKNPSKFLKTYNKRTFVDINAIMVYFDLGRGMAATVKYLAEQKWKASGVLK